MRELGIKRKRYPKKQPPGPVTCPDCGETRILKNTHPTAVGSGRCHRCAAKRAARAAGAVARDKVCVVCGGLYHVRGARVLTAKTCSRACRAVYMREKTRGSRRDVDNPNYRHGNAVGRKNWGVAAKGETWCRACGAGGNLHLHHAIPRSKYRAGREELRNGIALCASCHSRWHHRTLTIYRDVFSPEEWDWLTSVSLTGERIEDWLDRNYPERPVIEEAA